MKLSEVWLAAFQKESHGVAMLNRRQPHLHDDARAHPAQEGNVRSGVRAQWQRAWYARIMARRPISLDTQRYNKTLVRRLCPLVNVLRDLVVRFGLRGYSVRLVKVRWTGNRVGLGVPTKAEPHDQIA
jgi:hypothetical protein